jgi:hypothetical protein
VRGPFAKAGLVAIGYIAAGAIAWVVVSIYVAATSGPDRQGGMSAFGDSLLFLAVFGLAAVPATGAGLFFLRTRPVVWGTLSVVSLAVAFTSLAACLTYLAPTASDSGSLLHSWSAFATLRILVAPLFAFFFLLSGLFAPTRPARISLLAASTIEVAVFAYVAFTFFRPFHR